eukprot:8772222-Alexandrium_andersonii.AAC.1
MAVPAFTVDPMGGGWAAGVCAHCPTGRRNMRGVAPRTGGGHFILTDAEPCSPSEDGEALRKAHAPT